MGNRTINRVRNSLIPKSIWGLALVWFATASFAQNKRCDLLVKVTPGTDSSVKACLDLKALQSGGQAIVTANNATRISKDGFRICKNVTEVITPPGGDIVFIYDNSGSMMPNIGWVNPVAPFDTVFYYSCTDTSRVPGGITYQLATGAFRAIPRVSSNAGCATFSGDPYQARGEVMKKAMDYVYANANGSTIGAVSFTNIIGHEQPLLPMNLAANLVQVKNSIVLDTTGGTYYRPPLLKAYSWLDDTTLTRVRKPAIIFISDGAPTDSYTDILRANIPIYSIFLGYPTANFTALQTMSTTTGGTFNRVNPNNVAEINAVMQAILKAIIKPSIPLSMVFTNTSLNPVQVSRSTSITFNPGDSSLVIVLDNILALQQGTNNFTVQITLAANNVKDYKFTVNATGNPADVSTSSLVCYNQPKLTMINAVTNLEDAIFSAGITNYNVRLTRQGTDILPNVTVQEISRDTARPTWVGDQESSFLNQLSSAGNETIYQGPEVVNGSVATPIPGNGTLESSMYGELVLNWVHPRDPREFASYTLPGRKMLTINPFNSIEVVNPYTLGTKTINPTTGVVIGGLTWIRTDSKVIVDQKNYQCLQNCNITTLNPNDKISFLIKIPPAPFSYSISVFDNLGQFVMDEKKDRVDVSTIRKDLIFADTADKKNNPTLGLIIQIPTVAKTGQHLGTGVYIVKLDLKTEDNVVYKSYLINPAGEDVLLRATRIQKIQKAGYIRSL